MILEAVERNVRVSGLGKPIPFTIDEEDVGMITMILSDKIYSDKMGAIIREYIANAIDANREANSLRPFEITPPTIFEPVYKVRDFGFGLSLRGMNKTFVKFAKSTKRGNNDTIGTFGLGCKSGFTYTDSFGVTSWYRGIKRTYIAQRGQAGRLELYPVDRCLSDEPSGVEVTIPIKEKDIPTFNRKLAEFCKYLTIKPLIIGEVKIPEIDYIIKQESFFIERNHDGDSRVLMGNVTYPICTESLMPSFRNVRGVVLRVKLGEVDISPDREKLEYTTKTIDALNNKLTEVIEVVKTKTQTDIDSKTRIWEALECIEVLNQSFSGSLKLHSHDFTFKGRKIEDVLHEDFKGESYPKIYSLRTGRTRWNRRTGGYNTVKTKWSGEEVKPEVEHAKENSVIILVHPSTSIKIARFVEGYAEKYGNRPARVIVTENKNIYLKLFCDTWKPEQIVVDFKSLYKKIERTGGGSTGPRNIYGHLNGNFYNKQYRIPLHSISAKDRNYVFINTDQTFAVENISKYFQAARSLCIPFYAINKRHAKHIDSSWTPLEKKVEAVIEERIAKINREDYLIAKHSEAFNNSYAAAQLLNDCGSFMSKEDKKTVALWQKNFVTRNKTSVSQMDSYISIAKEILGKEIVIEDSKEILDAVEKVNALRKKFAPFFNIYELLNHRIVECGKDLKRFFALIKSGVDNSPELV